MCKNVFNLLHKTAYTLNTQKKKQKQKHNAQGTEWNSKEEKKNNISNGSSRNNW